ncbi:D-alanyl-D-alanine carboxypeptidase [Streptomyces sp. ISL-10]|nr:D-alanyl-D-alanine carboxypeptidase [Streptomyces sp. ISL-10]
MAGESPDRSEQRKSSGETTGSERDPRLTVFREGSPGSSGSPGAPESSASAPEPPPNERTAVFRTLAPRGAADAGTAAEETAGPSAESAKADEPDEPAEADGAGAAGDRPGDPSALRPEAPAGSGDADVVRDASDETSGSATAVQTAVAAAEDAGGAPGGSDGASALRADPGEADRADEAAAGNATDGGASAPQEGPDDTGGVRDSADASAASETETDGAEAAEKGLATADRADSADASASDSDDDGDSAADDDAASASEPPLNERTAVFRALPGRGAPAAGSDGPAAGADDAASGGTDARLRAAVAAWVGETDAETDSETDAKTDAATDGESAATDGESAAKSDAEASASQKASAEAPDSGGPASVNAKAKESAKASAGESGDDSPAKRPAVDQPTTTLKALRRPAVDQPTTALKLPPVPRPATESKPEAAPGAGRSSTFVPLRRDDARPPASQKPQAKAPAAPSTSSVPSAPPAVPADPPASLTEAERTKQQPLPPLDLLAELTNSPPPPETPVRTVVRRVKIWTPLVLLLLIVFAVVQMFRPLPDPALALTADAEVTFEGGRPTLPWPGEGQGQIAVSGLGVVGEFGEEKPVPIASVTKTMTAYIIMRDHPFKRGEDGASIRVDALAEKEGGYDQTNGESTLNTIKEGDTISERDALSAIMIPSANNVARLLARWDAGSEKAFVEKMNDTAKELGMTNTTYTDPSGLNASTVSTAADQVKLGQALVKNKAMVDITRQQEWHDPSGKRHSNYNTLMPGNGAIGIKTGSTTKAGGNLLFAAYKDIGGTTQTIVGAVLGQHKPSILETVNAVSEQVLVATRETLKAKTVVKKGDVVGHVDDGVGGLTPVVATKDMTVVGWSGLKVELGITEGGKKLPHTAKAGTVVGSLTAGSGAGTISVPVALQKDLVEPGFGDKLTRIA